MGETEDYEGNCTKLGKVCRHKKSTSGGIDKGGWDMG